MTLEQNIRNIPEDGDLSKVVISRDNKTIIVLDDYEGVLKVSVLDETASVTIQYLNGDKFYTTHEEAFYAE